MTDTTHQGAEGADTMTAGPGDLLFRSEWETTRTITHEEAHEIARRLIASHFNRTDCETARASIPANPDRDDDLLINSYIKQQARKDAATPAPRTDGGVTAGEDRAWPFERTRTYLLAELERLRADLHTIGADLTGEQGKAASWLDVATGRVANVSSVLASATPAQPAGAVPDGLRALSEAAKDVLAERQRQVDVEGWTAEHDDTHAQGELARAAACYATELDIWTGHEQADHKGRSTLIGAHRLWPWPQEWWKPTDRRRNLVKAGALILAEIERIDRASHPAGQSAGSGAETVKQFARAVLHGDDEHRGWLMEAAECFVAGKPLPEPRGKGTQQPAPDSPRTGDEGTEWVLVPTRMDAGMIAAFWRWKNTGSDTPGEFGDDRSDAAAYRAMIAARPAALEAQGAWKHSHEEPEIGRRHVRLYEDGSGAVLLVRHDTGLLDAEGCDFEPHSNYPLGLWAYTPNGFRLWAEDHGDNRLTVPAPPASSGQGGR